MKKILKLVSDKAKYHFQDISDNLSQDEKDGLVISTALHFLLIIFFVLTSLFNPYSMKKKKIQQEERLIIFDLKDLKIDKHDNIPTVKKAPEKPKIKEKIKTRKNFVERKELPKIKTVIDTKKSDKKAEKSEPVVKEKKDEPNVVLEDKKTPKTKEIKKKKNDKIKPAPVAPKEEVKQKPTGSLNDLLKSIEPKKKKEIKQIKEPVKETVTKKVVVENKTIEKQVDNSEISISYINAIKYKMRGCWNIDPGARDIRHIVVKIDVDLTPDGSINNVRIVDFIKFKTDASFRSVAESAKRALYNCSPYNLPISKYDQWKKITFNFSPAGQ